MTNTDRIEKEILLRAPRSRVWRAIANADEFGTWFRCKIDSPFQEGATVRGNITYPGYEHLRMEIFIDRMEPERKFVYRWHPAAVDPKVDYSSEPTTRVEFDLQDAEGGTLLRIVESGFDKLPLHRRAEAFRMNEGGWTTQTRNVEAYLRTSSDAAAA